MDPVTRESSHDSFENDEGTVKSAPETQLGQGRPGTQVLFPLTQENGDSWRSLCSLIYPVSLGPAFAHV